MSDEHERPHLDRGRDRPRPVRETQTQKRALEPGEKQPDHAGASERAQQTLNKLSDMRTDLATDTMKPSKERAQESGNPNKTPPHERTPAPGPAQTAAADIAASHLAAAESAIIAHETAEELLNRDPRRERDQKVYEMAVTGKIGLVPPSEAEKAAAAAKAGVPEEVADKIPRTAEEQVEEDMARLAEGEARAAAASPAGAASRRTDTPDQSPPTSAVRIPESVKAPTQAGTTGTGAVSRPSIVRPGEQENAPPNNLVTDSAGKQVGGAEGEKISSEEARRRADEAAASASGTVIK